MVEHLDAAPWWPTTTKMRLTNGRVVGVDGSVWAYRTVPLVPVVDARTEHKRVEAGSSLTLGIESLAAMAKTVAGRRLVNKGSYREIHVLSVSVPAKFKAPRRYANAQALDKDFSALEVKRRAVVLGVKLVSHIRREGVGPIRSAVDSIAESLTTGGIPLVEFDDDFRAVDAAMSRAGLLPASTDEMDLVSSWWNFGRGPNTPILVHADHLHVFTTTQASQTAARSSQDECASWRIPGQYPVTFAAVSSFENEWLPITDSRVLWGADLHAAGALAVSLRALVEPSKVTAGEMRRHIKQYESDMAERVAQGKHTKAEQDHDLAVLRQVEAEYSISGGPPTLHNTQITVALDQIAPDLSTASGTDYIELDSLAFRQRAAMAEQFLASHVRANPSFHDLPEQAITSAGLNSLSTVGDPDGGAMLGVTEIDRQPAYVSPSAVSDQDALPLMLIAGSTGSGKTMTMLHLARQWTAIRNRGGERTPVIFVDPKPHSDFADAVTALGGTVYSLDDLSSADGVFDPLRVMATPADGLDLAAAMLGEISPWPDGSKPHEVELLKALRFGVDNGARSIGHALRLAAAAGQVSEATGKPIFDLLDASPLFRAIFGTRDDAATLRAAEGITLIKVGAQALTLPQPGETSPQLVPRISQWVLRMMVYGSAAAVQGRQGVVMLDEAWQFVQGTAGAAEVQRLGRLARSMQVLPVLASQRIVDFTRAELQGYVSRGILLSLESGRGRLEDGSTDYGEAGAALDLFRIAKTDERLHRMSASQFLEGTRHPNWSSFKALRDPDTNELRRGAIGLYVDLSGRAIPVEVMIPPAFLREISTTATDIDARVAARTATPVSAPAQA